MTKEELKRVLSSDRFIAPQIQHGGEETAVSLFPKLIWSFHFLVQKRQLSIDTMASVAALLLDESDSLNTNAQEELLLFVSCITTHCLRRRLSVEVATAWYEKIAQGAVDCQTLRETFFLSTPADESVFLENRPEASFAFLLQEQPETVLRAACDWHSLEQRRENLRTLREKWRQWSDAHTLSEPFSYWDYPDYYFYAVAWFVTNHPFPELVSRLLELFTNNFLFLSLFEINVSHIEVVRCVVESLIKVKDHLFINDALYVPILSSAFRRPGSVQMLSNVLQEIVALDMTSCGHEVMQTFFKSVIYLMNHAVDIQEQLNQLHQALMVSKHLFFSPMTPVAPFVFNYIVEGIINGVPVNDQGVYSVLKEDLDVLVHSGCLFCLDTVGALFYHAVDRGRCFSEQSGQSFKGIMDAIPFALRTAQVIFHLVEHFIEKEKRTILEGEAPGDSCLARDLSFLEKNGCTISAEIIIALLPAAVERERFLLPHHRKEFRALLQILACNEIQHTENVVQLISTYWHQREDPLTLYAVMKEYRAVLSRFYQHEAQLVFDAMIEMHQSRCAIDERYREQFKMAPVLLWGEMSLHWWQYELLMDRIGGARTSAMVIFQQARHHREGDCFSFHFLLQLIRFSGIFGPEGLGDCISRKLVIYALTGRGEMTRQLCAVAKSTLGRKPPPIMPSYLLLDAGKHQSAEEEVCSHE